MLREEVLREWGNFRSKFLSKWEKRKGLLHLRSWIVREIFPYPTKPSEVSNEQIFNAIRAIRQKVVRDEGPQLEYFSESTTDSDTEEEN